MGNTLLRLKATASRGLVKVRQSPILFFIIVASLIGLVFAITSPPGFGLDERAHFMRVYLLSEGDFLPDHVGPDHEVGALLPVNLIQLVGVSTADILDNNQNVFFVDRHDADLKLYQPFFKDQFSSVKLDDHATNAQLLAADAYSPFGYLHMAAITKLARLAKLPLLYSMYLSRIVNLALYVVLVSLALYVLPRFRWLFVAVALLPTAVYQAACVSLDPTLNGLCFLLTALSIRYWYGKNGSVGWKQATFIAATLAGIALIKTPYVCLGLLALGLPANRFYSVRLSYILKAFWIAAILVPAVGWVIANRSVTPSLVLLQPGKASIPGQTKYIEHHPLSTAGAIVRTHYESIDHTFESLLGRAGDRQIGLPNAYMYGLFFLSTISALVLHAKDLRDTRLKKREPLYFDSLMALAAVATVLLISVTLYITFTPVGSPVVQGLQGRYFIPVVPLVLLVLFRRSPFTVTARETTALATLQTSSLLFLIATAAIYYVVNF